MVIDLSSPNAISLYFHIPFCTKKCDYCHFYVIPDNESHKISLLEGLKKEWDIWAPLIAGRTLESIYFGGGTPSLFGPERIATVLGWVKTQFPWTDTPPEITLEVNPENVTTALMKGYREAGINRVSLGLQSLDDTLLQILSRGHNSNDACNAVETVYKSGIENITVDLMYELPTQSIEQWQRTLRRTLNLPINHLSLYNLTIEPKTSFYKRREILNKLLPDEETRLMMYEHAVETFESAGLLQYEISAFAKEGHFSKHNTGYWTGRDFIGFGPSAFSYWEGRRFSNVSNLHKYTRALDEGKSPIDFDEKLGPEEHLTELLAVQLRLRCGVDLKAFAERYGTFSNESLHKIEKLITSELLFYNAEGRLCLTKRGILFYDTVGSEII